jgi:hypothetical protein
MKRRRVPARCFADIRPSSIYVRRILRAKQKEKKKRSLCKLIHKGIWMNCTIRTGKHMYKDDSYALSL